MNDNQNLTNSLIEAIVENTGFAATDVTKIVDFLHTEGFVDYRVVSEGIRD